MQHCKSRRQRSQMQSAYKAATPAVMATRRAQGSSHSFQKSLTLFLHAVTTSQSWPQEVSSTAVEWQQRSASALKVSCGPLYPPRLLR